MKKKIFSLIITIALLITCVAYISFALTSYKTNISNLNITQTITGEKLIFTIDGNKNMSYQLQTTTMNSNTIGDSFIIGTMNVAVSIYSITPATCTYDVIWTWDKENNDNNKYHKQSLENEMGINYYIISAEKTSLSDHQEYTMANNVDGIIQYNLPDYNDNNLQSVLYRGQISTNNIYNNELDVTNAYEVKENIVYNILFKNTSDNQSQLKGGKFNGNLSIDNIECNVIE